MFYHFKKKVKNEFKEKKEEITQLLLFSIVFLNIQIYLYLFIYNYYTFTE